MPIPTSVSTSTLNLRKEVADIVYGLDIPYEDTTFHCSVQNDCSSSTYAYDPNYDLADFSYVESAIWNPENDSDLESELDTTESVIPEPTKSATILKSPTVCQLLMKLISNNEICIQCLWTSRAYRPHLPPYFAKSLYPMDALTRLLV